MAYRCKPPCQDVFPQTRPSISSVDFSHTIANFQMVETFTSSQETPESGLCIVSLRSRGQVNMVVQTCHLRTREAEDCHRHHSILSYNGHHQ